MKKLLVVSLLSVSMMGLGSSVFAQGIPTIDAASIVQLREQLEAARSQLAEAEKARNAITGYRGFGDLLTNDQLRSFLPDDANTLLDGLNSGNIDGMADAIEKILSDEAVGEDYNQAQQDSVKRQRELQATKKFMSSKAYEASKDRLDDIDDLMKQISRTEDPKAIAELQARISGEQALIQGQLNQLHLLTQLVEAEETLIEEQQKRALQEEFRADKTGMPSIL